MKGSIVFAEFHPWNSTLKVGGHHYAERFAQDGWRVLWLANFLNWNRLIRRSEYDRLYLQAWRSGVAPVAKNVYTYTPLSYIPYIDLPVLSSLAVARSSLRWCWPSLKRELEGKQFDPVDVLWISQPRMYSLVKLVRHRFLAYRMFDDVQYFDGEPQSINQVEEWLCREANVVFATSRHLVDKANQWNRNVVYLPNGADVERFQNPNLTLPTELTSIPEPRLLYVGAIAEWFDFDIVSKAARIKPEWSFILIGPWSAQIQHHRSRLEEIPNVYCLGPRKADAVPGYMKYADIGLIPFQVNELTHSVSPIKLFEYSAAGMPVIAPRLREIQGYEAPILYYDDLPQFIEAIETGLISRDELTERFMEFGLNNSWEFRYRTICERLY